MYQILKQIITTGIKTEAAPVPDEALRVVAQRLQSSILDNFAGALTIRHVDADLLLVTGPVSRHMAVALRRTFDATPEPKLVVALGDCGCTGGMFGESYASCGRVSNVIPVDVAVPGCPPAPFAIMQGILTAISGSKI